jgi:DNA invertase Pin-like site-specific DNA recombinase
MAIYGFIAATEDRNMYHQQYFGIMAYGVQHMLRRVEFVEEAEFGLVDHEGRRLGKLVDTLVDGDVLIVSDIHRLGNSTYEIIGVLMEILLKGSALCAVDGEYDVGDIRTYRGIPCILSILLEARKALALERSTQPAKRKLAEGTPILGRPVGSRGVSRLDGRESDIVELLGSGLSKAEIARQLSVSRPALYDFIASRNLCPAEYRRSNP